MYIYPAWFSSRENIHEIGNRPSVRGEVLPFFLILLFHLDQKKCRRDKYMPNASANSDRAARRFSLLILRIAQKNFIWEPARAIQSRGARGKKSWGKTFWFYQDTTMARAFVFIYLYIYVCISIIRIIRILSSEMLLIITLAETETGTFSITTWVTTPLNI